MVVLINVTEAVVVIWVATNVFVVAVGAVIVESVSVVRRFVVCDNQELIRRVLTTDDV